MKQGSFRRLFLSGTVIAGVALGATSAAADTKKEKAPAEAKTDAKPAENAPAAKLETPPEYRTELKLPSGEVVKRGMTVAEVVKLMGEPREKRPLKAGNETAEIWVYQTDTTTSAPKTIHSDTIVTYDNHQGYQEKVQIPQYKIEQTIVSDIRELLFFEGRLLNFKESRRVKSTMQ